MVTQLRIMADLKRLIKSDSKIKSSSKGMGNANLASSQPSPSPADYKAAGQALLYGTALPIKSGSKNSVLYIAPNGKHPEDDKPLDLHRDRSSSPVLVQKSRPLELSLKGAFENVDIAYISLDGRSYKIMVAQVNGNHRRRPWEYDLSVVVIG